MSSRVRSLGSLIGLFLLLAGLLTFSRQPLPSPFPPLSDSLSAATSTLQDFVNVSLGFRRLSADLAWIQTLQYYGSHSDIEADEARAKAGTLLMGAVGDYPLFLDYCRRVVHIDPYFTYAFYYGSSVLGWNLNRLDEAEAFLKEGIRLNPKEWRLQQYLASLGYQKNHNMKELTAFLEVMVQDPEAPNILKSILANLYKKSHQYDKSYKLWKELYLSPDPAYHMTALERMREIKGLKAL